MLSSTMANETSSAGQRFDSWVLERVRQRRGATELPLTLEYRQIYVMPTRFGLWFGLLLALTAIGGLNFNNNMTLMLSFLIAAVGTLSRAGIALTLAGITAAFYYCFLRKRVNWKLLAARKSSRAWS